MIGKTIGNYRVVRLLGEGGMGVVYEAEHPGIGRRVAVKLLHPGWTEDQDITNRFFNEARAANAIRHSGIVEVFDFGVLPTGESYIVMELLEGQSLAARLARSGRMPPAQAVELGAQTADVLAAAHAGGIVHRDLKPDNLFLVPDDRNPGTERVKVLDFGIAKLGVGSSGISSVKTRTGAVMGTPAYMSPEQCRGTREVDHRTDIYALGVILYEMICGRPPFVSEGFGEMVHLHISAPPAPPRTHLATLSPELEAIILRCLEKEPADRFQTMGELQRALSGRPAPALAPAVVPRQEGPSEGEVARVPTRPMAQTTFSQGARGIDSRIDAAARRTKRPLVAVVVLAAASIGGMFLLRRDGSHPPEVVSAPEAPAESSPSAAGTVSPNVAGAGRAAAPEPRTVTVAIASTPSGVQVVRERDGAILGFTPFRGSWPAGTGVEALRIEKSGYRPELVTVPLDRGVDLSFVLEALASPSAARKKSPVARAPATPAAPAAQPAKPTGRPDARKRLENPEQKPSTKPGAPKQGEPVPI